MKKKTSVLLLSLLTMAALASAGTKGSWTGWITDAHCGAKGAKAEHKECSLKCVSKGEKLVFYNSADQKIYSIDKQDLAKDNLGQEVTVTGEANGTDIKVESIAPAKAGA
jgi:hypothetical protein